MTPITPLLPNAMIAQAYLLRGIRLWISVRLLASATLLLGGASPLPLWANGSTGFVAAVVLLAYIDFTVRKERAFIANLGVPLVMMAAICAAPAVAGEVLITVVGLLR